MAYSQKTLHKSLIKVLRMRQFERQKQIVNGDYTQHPRTFPIDARATILRALKSITLNGHRHP